MINFDGFFLYCAGGPNIFILPKIRKQSQWQSQLQ